MREHDVILAPEENVAAFQQSLEQSYPDYALQQLESVAGSQERKQYWQNVCLLDEYIANAVAADPPQTIIGVLTLIDSQLARIIPPEQRFMGLTNHLNEITQFMSDFLYVGDTERFAGLLEQSEFEAMVALIAPIHDLLKFLSKPSGQIMPDHEQVTAYLLRKHFGNIRAISHQISFAASVIEDHENLYRETRRREFIVSKSAVERAKALFFIADVLTGVLLFDDNRVSIDKNALKERFTDLYVRHIDRLVSKVFRPEWGLYAMGDIITTLTELSNHYQLQIEENWQQILVGAAQEAIDRARSGESEYTPEQFKRIDAAQAAINELLVQS